MGATAITVLAGARILNLPAALPVTRATAGFVEGFSFTLWAFGTWWIPLLLVLGLWRHVRRHWPFSYEPTLWSVVFPLGMYSVATLSFGKVAHLSFMEPLSRFMLWVAVAAWVVVAVAFLVRLARRSGEPHPARQRRQPARQPLRHYRYVEASSLTRGRGLYRPQCSCRRIWLSLPSGCRGTTRPGRLRRSVRQKRRGRRRCAPARAAPR